MSHKPRIPAYRLRRQSGQAVVTLTDSVLAYHWGHLIAAAILGTFWAGLAALLFRRYGCNPSTNPFWLRNRLASLGMVRLQALLSWTACFLFLSARAIRLIGRT